MIDPNPQSLEPRGPDRTAILSTIPDPVQLPIENVLPEVPDYEILAEIGRGGMGIVYKARHLQSGQVRAIKLILVEQPNSLHDLLRFRLEAEAIACLNHPNVIKIRGVGVVTRGMPYLVLDYAPGGNLADLTRRSRPTPRQAAEQVLTLSGAVQQAHVRGITHRDLKPSNVLVTEDGRLMVSDFGLAKFARPVVEVRDHFATIGCTGLDACFGAAFYKAISTHRDDSGESAPGRLDEVLAKYTVEEVWDRLALDGQDRSPAELVYAVKSFLTESRNPVLSSPSEKLDRLLNELTRAGTVMGSPGYMAPEQAAGNTSQIGPACDVYGLGAVLYYLLAGRPPFQGPTFADVLNKVRTVDPDPIEPAVNCELEAICRTCLAKPIEARYRSAEALAEDLRRFLGGTATLAFRERAADRPVPSGTPREVERTLTQPASPVVAITGPAAASVQAERTKTWWQFWK